MSAKVKVKKSKSVEIEEFRMEVQNYIRTGQSALLTDKEKANLDKLRPKASIANSLLSFFMKKN
jgi:hypothetical protein